MSERTNDTASVRRSHEHSAQSDSADKQESERDMTTEQQTAKYESGQHVHVGDRPGTIEIVDPGNDIAPERLYRVRFNDGTSYVAQLHELSSCDLAAALRDELQSITAAADSRDDDVDHGPGCDGPLNCTCGLSDSNTALLFGEEHCARKLAEFDAVRETISSAISALQRAQQDLSSWEIDDYADMSVIAVSAALEEIGGAAVALVGVVAVMCDSHPGDGNWDDQGHCSAEQLRNGHAVSVTR